MTTQQLADDPNKVQSEFLQLFSRFDQELINIVPFKGSWTPGQLAQHVILSNTGLLKFINGRVEDTERPIDQWIEILNEQLLDFSKKLESPAFIVPPFVSYEKEIQISTLEAHRKQTANDVRTLDLSKTCIDFQLPGIGHMTRLEIFSFMLVHTKRHIHQLKNMQLTMIKN